MSRPFALTSPAFRDGQLIPRTYACEGQNISVPLEWHNVPAGTVSLALLLLDPDTAHGTWTHWVMYDIPGHTDGLTAGARPLPLFRDGLRQGRNSNHHIGYDGPCPPHGDRPHRYYFVLYALPGVIGEADLSGAELQAVAEEHALGVATLMGRYAEPAELS